MTNTQFRDFVVLLFFSSIVTILAIFLLFCPTTPTTLSSQHTPDWTAKSEQLSYYHH